jgi:hypothetical protein
MTRKELSRALAVNAITKPVNVLAPSAVLVAGLLLGAPWLAPVALVCWLALVSVTFFDEREARAAGERARAGRREDAPRPAAAVRAGRFAPEIAGRLRLASSARASIRAAVEDSAAPLDDVVREVDALVVALEGHAARAQRIRDFLRDESPEDLRARIAAEPSDAVRVALEAKLSALERLQRRLTRLLEEMDHVVATLQTVHAEVLVTDGLEQSTLASQVSVLRENVQAVSTGLEDAFAQTRAG